MNQSIYNDVISPEEGARIKSTGMRRVAAVLGLLAAATAMQVAVARVQQTNVLVNIAKQSSGNTIAPGTVFSFTITENSGATVDRSTSIGGVSAQYSTFIETLGLANFVVQELPVTGIRLTSINCAETDAQASSATFDYDLTGANVAISVVDQDTNPEEPTTFNSNINCVFNNEALPKVTIVKHVVPPGNETFTFNIRGEVDLRRAVSSVITNAVVNLTDNGSGVISYTFFAEHNFVYQILEQERDPWVSQAPACTLGNPIGPINGQIGASMYLQYGNDVTCEFTNTLTTLDLVKVVSGPIGGEFVFTVTRTFDDCGDGCIVTESKLYSLTVPANGRITHTFVITDRPGVSAHYEIFEPPVPGFSSSDPVCTNVSTLELGRGNIIPPPADPSKSTGTFQIPAGVAAQCVFTNTPNVLNVVKVIEPAGSDSFGFELNEQSTCLSRGSTCHNSLGMTLTDNGSGRVTKTMLLTHTGFVNFVLREPIPDGYAGNGISCVGGLPSEFLPTPETTDQEAGFGFNASGQNITCTASNIKLSTLVVVKDARPDTARPFTVTVNHASKPTPGLTGNINLTDTASVVLVDTGVPGPNQHVFNNVLGGTGGSSEQYTIFEQSGPRTNMHVTCISANNQGGNVHEYENYFGGGYLGNVPIRAGDMVTCTIVNELPGTLVIIKDTVPDASTPFTFSVEIHPDDEYCQGDRALARPGGGDNPVGCANFQGADVFTLIDDGTAVSNTRSYAELRTFRYLITELSVPPYAQSAACQSSNQSSTSQVTGGLMVDLSLGAGDTVTCTFTNSAPTPTPTLTPTPTQTPTPTLTPTPTNTATPSPTPTATPRVGYTLVLTSNPPSGSQVASGQLVTYFVTFSANALDGVLARGDAVHANATITTLIPSNSSLVAASITNGGGATGNNVVWQLANFNAGDVFRAQYIVRVSGGVDSLQNSAVAGVIGLAPFQSAVLVHPLPPSPVNLAGFTARGRNLGWTTLGETLTSGFLLYRVDGATTGRSLPQGAVQISGGMIAAYGPAAYSFTDRGALNGRTYTYFLVEVDVSSNQHVIASATTTIAGAGTIFLPLTAR